MSKRKTQEEFIKEVYDLTGNEYTVLGQYKNTNTKIRMQHNCKKCNYYKFKSRPGDFLHGSRCPKCARKVLLTTDEFKEKIYDLVKDEYSVIGEYRGANEKILMQHKCEKCNNYEWDVRLNTVLRLDNT